MKYAFLAVLAAGMFMVSCNKDTVPDPPFTTQLLTIGQEELPNGVTVTLAALDTLRTGFNPIFVEVTKNGAPLRTDVTLSTMMDMGTMHHSSPSVDPVFLQEPNLYEGAVVFTMPSASKEWSVIVNIDGEEVVFNTDVKQNSNKTVGTFTASDNRKFVISMYPHAGFRVGNNPFILFISEDINHMDFEPVSDLTVAFTPEMPSMGHGSPNNVDPQSKGRGFYQGQANFTMTGDWRLHFKISSGETVLIEDAAFDIVF